VSTGRTIHKIASVIVLCLGVFCLGFISPASATPSQSQSKTKAKPKKQQKPQLPALPSGPTGPVQPIPLDSIAPVPPQVSYQNSQLTIVAANSTLGDILRAVRKQTGAEIEIPPAPERVVTRLGPGSARDVMAELLNGSRFNYVLLGSPADTAVLTRVVLVAKSGPDSGSSNNPSIAEQPQPGIMQRSGGPGAATLPEVAGEANDAEATDNNADDAPDQAAAEPQPPPPASSDQPVVKTPQQMLQEMQQRQLQLQQQQGQQQQQPGQPPYPGQGVPPQPPQDR
jgi:hypothetical protein